MNGTLVLAEWVKPIRDGLFRDYSRMGALK